MTKDNRVREMALRLTAPVLCLAAFAAILAPAIKADDLDRETVFTFNAPVEIPGKVLPAGTYIFKLLDGDNDRRVVQISGKSDKKVYATLLAVSADATRPRGRTIVTFQERPSGEPEALKSWFYPGDTIGWEFVYPHERATALARRTKQKVLSMKDELKENTNTTETSADNPRIREMQKADVSVVDPSGADLGPMTSASKQPGK